MTIKYLVEKYIHSGFLLDNANCHICENINAHYIWIPLNLSEERIITCDKCYKKAREYVKHIELQKLRNEKIKRLKK